MIKNKKLYLVSFLGFIKNNVQVDLKYLFQNKTEVFAYWFSCDIRIPEGDLLQKINTGYASVYSRDRILNFNKGILISETVKDNTKSKPID